MSDLLNKASLVMVPSGYKEDTVYSVVPSDGNGDLTFTRASNGTRVNSAGLVEVCPWNFIEYSEQFTSAAWATSNGATVSADQTTAPNGTTTADKIVFPANSAANIYNFPTSPVGSNNISVYAKTLSGTKQFRLRIDTGSGPAVSSNFTATTEWQRFDFAVTTTAANLVAYIFNDSTGVAGDLYVWGAQLNIGSTAKPYFPTTDRLNVPRLTYQNGGGGCPSLLLEKQSTNIVLQSNAMATTPWQNFGGSQSNNSAISPDGTQNASTFSRTGGGAGVYQTCGVDAGATYTATMYAKLGTATNICLVINNAIAWNTVGGQSFTTADGLSTTAWKRVQYTFTAPSNGNINIHIGDHAETAVTPQSAGSFFIWGVQIEKSSYPTSVIQTTSSSATRVADECKKTGISSLIGQAEGVVFVDFMVTDPANNQSIQIYNNEKNASAISVISIQFNIDTVIGQIFRGNGTFDNILLAKNGYGLNQRLKVAFRYKSGDLALYINGVQADTDLGTYTANGTKAEVNLCDPSVYFAYKGCVNFYDFVQFPTALTNAELASLTTL